jgi:hypothetical protein
MAKNPYFKINPIENRLYEDIIIEMIKIYGYDVVYMPRKYQKQDKLLGEDVLSKFDKIYEIEMYYPAVNGPSGTDYLSKFGIEIQEVHDLVVSKKRFREIIGQREGMERPAPGDLVYLPLTNSLLEIKSVDDADPEVQFNPLDKSPVYRIVTQNFVYSYEDINTGVSIIDSARGEIVTNLYNVGLTGSSSTSEDRYYVGEKIYVGGSLATATSSGTVINWYPDTKTIEVSLESGGFTSGTVIGETSNARYVINSTEVTNIKYSVENFDDGPRIELERNQKELFDFSDVDPFSEGNY